jgi:exonuclease SbcC
MILHSVRVDNWRKLTDISLGPFLPGITVIAGPNRTGKSSLCEAIRCALIEWQYDTSQVREVVPWHTDSVPVVSIEFEAGGQRYLLEKRFTKRKGGGAELHRVLGAERQQLAEGKEATPRVQQLLGIGSAKSGVAQLLWVNQGEVGMPAVDKAVGDGLRRHLGTVITGQDQLFHGLLWGRMTPWFTNEQNCQSASKTDPPSASKTDPPRLVC